MEDLKKCINITFIIEKYTNFTMAFKCFDIWGQCNVTTEVCCVCGAVCYSLQSVVKAELWINFNTLQVIPCLTLYFLHGFLLFASMDTIRVLNFHYGIKKVLNRLVKTCRDPDLSILLEQSRAHLLEREDVSLSTVLAASPVASMNTISLKLWFHRKI